MTSMKSLLRIRTSKLFEKDSINNFDFDEPLAVMLIEICLHTRTFVISAAAGHLIIYTFDVEAISRPAKIVTVSTDLMIDLSGSFDDNDDSGMEEKSVLKLRSNSLQNPGFQAVSVIFAVEGDDEPSNICALSINTNWGICVVGTANGIIVIDYIQDKKILAMSTMDLLR